MRRWGVLISGRGSNLGALIDARSLGLDLRVVVSSSPQAAGLLRARRAGVPTVTLASKIDWSELDRTLRDYSVTHVILAGFMKIVPAKFVDAWTGRILNLHPSLLPNYPGLKSIERAHADRAPMGMTIHEVTAEVDAGRVIGHRQTLDHPERWPLAKAEFLIHVDEQRLLKEAVERW